MCDRRMWSQVEPQLTASGRPVFHADLTGASSISGIAQAILTKAPPHFIPVGLSMGGIVAFELFRQAPERLSAMVLSDTNAAPETPERETMRRAQQEQVRAGCLAEVVREELKPAYFAKANAGRSDILDLTLNMALDLGADVFLSQTEALIGRADSRPDLGRIGCPALLLCGAEDPVCPPDLHRAMADAMPHAGLRLIDGAGHLPPLEQPERFAAALLSWLNTLN
jgi:pimeloyl-ACP methyl ester carboxylesterase